MTKDPRISVAIPLYNEEAVVPELLQRTLTVLDGMPGGPHQVVLVDDGSSDCTCILLEEAAEKNPRLTVIALSRNFGHQTALAAALDYVSGEVTILMDGDLQDPPEAIPLFVETYKQGYDVVYAQRVKRKESWWLRACYYSLRFSCRSMQGTSGSCQGGSSMKSGRCQSIIVTSEA